MMDKEKLIKVLEDDEIEQLLWKVDKLLVKKLGGNLIEDGYPDIFDIINAGVNDLTRKRMYIVDARIGEEAHEGYAIQFTNDDEELLTESAYRVGDDCMVTQRMVEKLRHMAWLGYELCQTRDRRVEEVFK